MEKFTNEIIDTAGLPQFEEVRFSKLHPLYWKVLLISECLYFSFLGTALFVASYFFEEIEPYQILIWTGFTALVALTVILSGIGFKKKGFAFRTHDVLFQYGVIATKTIIIPYNRIQHVALEEGLISRYFGLAKVEVFTAGGGFSGDIVIPGIEKEQAEKIKQLLMTKIQKQL